MSKSDPEELRRLIASPEFRLQAEAFRHSANGSKLRDSLVAVVAGITVAGAAALITWYAQTQVMDSRATTIERDIERHRKRPGHDGVRDSVHRLSGDVMSLSGQVRDYARGTREDIAEIKDDVKELQRRGRRPRGRR